MQTKYTYFFLFLIFLFACMLRLYGIDWDQKFHLHPDERQIVLTTLSIHPPAHIAELFSQNSPWNPHFFAYGSLPIYFLKAVSSLAGTVNPLLATYTDIDLVGRFLSVLFDLGTIFFIYLLGRKTLGENVGAIGSFLYAASVLPIQLAHFYTVDTLLTFFVTATLYALIRLYEKPTVKKSLFVGVLFGLALATKNSALALTASIGIALVIDFLLISFKNPHRIHIWFPHLPHVAKRLLVEGCIICLATITTFVIAEPYALLDFKNFLSQTLLQSTMTHNAFLFPYTLQYVGKIPYLYELTNIFLWGMGPFIAFFAFAGTLFMTIAAVVREKQTAWAKELILVVFFWGYFLVVGKFAIGFMRYMLPVYPLLCLFAAALLMYIFRPIFAKKNKLLLYACSLSLSLLFLICPLTFISIYTKPNTRVIASEWINKTIPPGKTIATEHWDDTLPLYGQNQYFMQILPFYDPDTPQKWQQINTILQQTDYIIIASDRLYKPLQELTNCQQLPLGRCYPQSAMYYKHLFSGELGFQNVATFSNYPTLPLLNIPIYDGWADESFYVFDHPTVMIFKRNETVVPLLNY